ncbi:MAG TPA: VLRF1 family aeRF1-type release factor [Longimicrobiales bacterium]|nr:VLRF1 family aeRF1-type release factor [Longimicrobiales bacterium]
MISRDQLQRLIDRRANGNPILSVFLDMSVNSDNKRTYDVFLNKRKSDFRELSSDRDGHHREAVGAAFARLEKWVEEEFDEANKGLAMYMELDGDWTETIEIPLPVENRLVVDERPVVAPLVEIIERYHHHGVILVDREHLRLLSIYLDQTLHETEVRTEPYPAPHDLKRGGFSAKDFQQRKAEETRHFFKEFAAEVEAFHRKHRPDDLIILGTHENVKKFSEFLPDALRKKVVHTDRLDVGATSAEVREKLGPVFLERLEREEAEAVNLFRDRVREAHKAVSGFDDTLEQLQEGKVETLIIARAHREPGGRCEKCGFLLARTSGDCPYCGGTVRDGVDLVEEMIRMAEDQDARIDFAAAPTLAEFGGVGGLLRF